MAGAFIEKVDELKEGVSEIAGAGVEEYFKERPSLRSMPAWLEVRNEREIGAARMISPSRGLVDSAATRRCFKRGLPAPFPSEGVRAGGFREPFESHG